MKRINFEQMAKTTGGAKCIYHFMLAAATLGNPIGMIGNWLGGNYHSVAECWNNVHVE